MASPPPLRVFLKDRMTSDSDWNLTGMGKDAGKYKVNDEEYDHFLDLVNTHIFGSKASSCSVLEKHRDVGPLLVDLDFKYSGGGPLVRRFSIDDIKNFVIQYLTALIYFTEIESLAQMETLRFYVMMKPAAESDGKIHKDGVHIQCPDLVTLPKLQFGIRGFLLQRGTVETVFGATGLTNTAEDCYDVSVIHRNNWFVYGACKPNKAQYRVVQVFTASMADIVEGLNSNVPQDFDELAEVVADFLESQPCSETNRSLIKTLSIRLNCNEANAPPVRAAHASLWDELMSCWGSGKAKCESRLPTIPVSTRAASEEEMIVATENEERRNVNAENSAEDVALAYRIARQCLNPEKRAKRYEDWVNLAICMRNIADTEESFRVWMEISRRVPGYESKMSDNEYKQKWNQLRTDTSRRLKMGSLRYWAKDDSPKTYMDICAETNADWILNFAKDTHVNVASFVCRLFEDEFRCSVGAKRGHEWFQYRDHFWKHLRTNNELRARLSNEVRNNYIRANSKLGYRLAEAVEAEKDVLEKKRKNLFTIERQLEMASFKDNIMKECQEKFYDEEFITHLNCNPYLIGVSNGVLDLQNFEAEDGRPHVVFRPGRPDDYVSFQMGHSEPDMEAIPYIPYDPNSQEQRDLMEFFRKIYPDEVVREYNLTLLSSCLEGQNKEQRFYVNQGRGSNGKSMIQALMRYTFGDYQTSLQTTTLTRKRPESGAANPDMIVTKCKRYIYMGEPDQGERINTARMKQLSGEDIVEARGLFSEQEKFKMMGKIFLACNDLPPVSSMDNGTWRRIRVIPHISTFVDPGKPTDPENNIYEKDLHLDHKLRKWRTSFLSLLVHYYETRYLVRGLQEPECVLAASNKYKLENDAFHAFLDECYVLEAGAGPVRFGEIMESYREWKKTAMTKADMKKSELVQRLKDVCDRRSTDTTFWGIRAREGGELAQEESDAESFLSNMP